MRNETGVYDAHMSQWVHDSLRMIDVRSIHSSGLIYSISFTSCLE